MYGNNRNYGNRNYNNQNSYNGPYPNQPRQYGPQPRPQTKKSGAVYTTINGGKWDGFIIVNGWNKSRSKGMITVKVAPYNKTDEVITSQKGKEYVRMIAEVFYKKTGNTVVIPCLMNVKTKTIPLQKIGMVVSPNGSGQTASGKKVTGYFGTMFKR